MTISPVSNVNSLIGVNQAQDQKGPKPGSNSRSEPQDTVQLSPAALAHLKGADADGDGDGR